MAILDINLLPTPETLKHRCQAYALLDACLSIDWEDRYFSFNSKWDEAKKEQMASFRNGMGAEYFIHFSEYGVCSKVFDGVRDQNIALLLDAIPDSFSSFKSEAAFSLGEASYFFYRSRDALKWELLKSNPNSDSDLLHFLVGGFDVYYAWAIDYYGSNFDREIAYKVYTNLSVNEQELSALNKEHSMGSLYNDLEEIGVG